MTVFDCDGGADSFDGGDGRDTIIYSGRTSGITVDLLTGITSDGDTLINIEYVDGSEYNDIITGSDVHNQLCKNAGDDIICGKGGDDSIIASVGNDTY